MNNQLSVEDQLKLDLKIYGVAYYRIVDGLKERINPVNLVTMRIIEPKLTDMPKPEDYPNLNAWSSENEIT